MCGQPNHFLGVVFFFSHKTEVTWEGFYIVGLLTLFLIEYL